MKVVVSVECTGYRKFEAYAQIENGFLAGAGNTPDNAIADFVECSNEFCKIDNIDNDYDFVYNFDLSSYLYQLKQKLSLSTIANVTGINKTRINEYATGKIIPNKKTSERIFEKISSFVDTVEYREPAYL